MIVLAFVVLVTGLVVAFFSRAVAERQISNSSANETKVDLTAQGAVDAIIGDLKQEIAAGSTSYTGTDGVTIYVPTTPVTAVPALALTGSTGISGTSFAPNLLKRSAYSQASLLWHNELQRSQQHSPCGGGDCRHHDHLPGPKSRREGSLHQYFPKRTLRFSRPLEPAAAPPQSNCNERKRFPPPVTAAPNAFVAPDWILVARDGSNPTISDLSGANSQYSYLGNPTL